MDRRRPRSERTIRARIVGEDDMRARERAFRLRAKATSLARNEADRRVRRRRDTVATATAHAAVVRWTTGVGAHERCAEELCRRMNVDSRIRQRLQRLPGSARARWPECAC